MILISGATGIYFFYSKNNNFLLVDPGKLTDSVSNVTIGRTSRQPQPETNNNNKSAAGRKDVPKPSVKNNKFTIPAGSPGSKKYIVITKAYFYNSPDTGKRKGLYLQPRKDLELSPANEQNGFVYEVYVNKKGQITKGWLNKKDLQPVE